MMQHRQDNSLEMPMNIPHECQHSSIQTEQRVNRSATESKADASVREQDECAMDVFIQGPLNDESQLPQFPHRKIELIAIDWSGVSYVCSAGIVSWLHWLKLVQEQKPSIKFEYKGCPTSLVQAFQKVRELKPKNAALTSLQIPYRLGDTECSLLISMGQDLKKLTASQLLVHIEREISSRSLNLNDVEDIEIDLTESDLAFLAS